MTAPLIETLGALARLLDEARRPWCVIGGAAMALHGADVGPADVDVLVSRSDAHRLRTRLGAAAISADPSPRFRSAIFLRSTAAPLPIEIMAGFEVLAGGHWRRVRPAARAEMRVDGIAIFVAGIDDLRRMARLFGRPKDLERLPLLDVLGQSASIASEGEGG